METRIDSELMARWYKKDVTLDWRRARTSFAVAQEVFSSHDVDAGSRALLKALDVDALPETGHVIDYGCGYGVLGLAFKLTRPQWTLDLVDRDALAVAFAKHNARVLGCESGSRFVHGLGPDMGRPADLLLWNMPGKIGTAQQVALTHDVVQSTRPGGMIAIVVVNPLAETVLGALAAAGVETVNAQPGTSDHTLIFAQAPDGTVLPGDPFPRGVFDRDPWTFEIDEFAYDMTPVVGLPDYDELGFDVQLVLDLFHTAAEGNAHVLVLNPGQGHVPVVAAHRFAPKRITLVDRDALALRASARVLADNGFGNERVTLCGRPDIGVEDALECQLVVVMCEDQVRNDVHLARLGDIAENLSPGGSVIVAGKSSVVSRFTGLAAKAGKWKARDKVKRSGFAAARLERSNVR